MSSPLAPVVANIFMDFYESKWLNEYNFHEENKFMMTLFFFCKTLSKTCRKMFVYLNKIEQ